MTDRLIHPARPEPEPPAWRRDRVMEEVWNSMMGIRFGEVRVVIQDGVVVQIERMEKQRLR